MLQKLYFLLTNGGGDFSTGEENEGMISSSSDSSASNLPTWCCFFSVCCAPFDSSLLSIRVCNATGTGGLDSIILSKASLDFNSDCNRTHAASLISALSSASLRLFRSISRLF